MAVQQGTLEAADYEHQTVLERTVILIEPLIGSSLVAGWELRLATQ